MSTEINVNSVFNYYRKLKALEGKKVTVVRNFPGSFYSFEGILKESSVSEARNYGYDIDEEDIPGRILFLFVFGENHFFFDLSVVFFVNEKEGQIEIN